MVLLSSPSNTIKEERARTHWIVGIVLHIFYFQLGSIKVWLHRRLQRHSLWKPILVWEHVKYEDDFIRHEEIEIHPPTNDVPGEVSWVCMRAHLRQVAYESTHQCRMEGACGIWHGNSQCALLSAFALLTMSGLELFRMWIEDKDKYEVIRARQREAQSYAEEHVLFHC